QLTHVPHRSTCFPYTTLFRSHKTGVPFLAGTDTPAGVHIFPGYSLHEELQRFVAAGFTPVEALQTATINPARFFGMEDQLGTVRSEEHTSELQSRFDLVCRLL